MNLVTLETRAGNIDLRERESGKKEREWGRESGGERVGEREWGRERGRERERGGEG